MNPADVRADRRLTWALRYGILESIQIVIDVACAVVSRRNLGYPQNYRECIELLGQERYINDELAGRLARAVGMRNILIHEYMDVDDGLVFSALDDLSDFEQFARQLVRAIQP